MRARWMATCLSAAALAACGGDDKHDSTLLDASTHLDSSVPVTDAGAGPGDAAISTSDAGTTAPLFDCVSGTPTSYLDILNACTDSEKVTKNPLLPLLMADGGLPPLP